jgi:dienelactone hydrolase
VPVLLAVPDGPGDRPVVLWFHGFRADALANARELLRVADAGFLAVGVDAVGHGRRADPGLPDRIATTPGGAFPVMLAMADATATEIPTLLAGVAARGLGDAGRVGLVGVSMGAFVVYRALAGPGASRESSVRAAVAILGSPEWPGPDSPHLAHASTFHDVALLSITAERDESVPPAATRRFHDRLAREGLRSARHRHVELPGAPHLVDAPGWEVIMRETLDWLSANLR